MMMMKVQMNKTTVLDLIGCESKKKKVTEVNGVREGDENAKQEEKHLKYRRSTRVKSGTKKRKR